MFGNNGKDKRRNTPEVPAAVAAAPARSRVPSIISADMTIKGELRSLGELHLDGTVEGNVAAERLVVGESASLKGDVHADSVRVCGRLEGNVVAREVVLTATCRVFGDITHEVLTMEPGAKFAGAVRHAEPAKPAATAGVVPLLRPAEPAPAATQATPAAE